ncbi:hypothetical protein [Paractinoplanes hotanensis]|uniref:Translation initiation factor 2 n=1 Tax=Paractinoplanes hotanensis TaxID=2906497 RepID=A0ABT0XV51_9ACTN|nr:hypothetical protein [Actinoplanes hotanensis]MCM4076969.1 hypothetical protein [Actinoplanes hotanensis]
MSEHYYVGDAASAAPQIVLDADERVLWSGRCAVAEYAFDEPASLPRWTLPEETAVVISDQRVLYLGPGAADSGELRWPWPQHLRVQPGSRDTGRQATVTQIQLVCAGPNGTFPALVFAGGDLTTVRDADRVANLLRQAIARYRVEHASELGIAPPQVRMLSRLVIGPEFNNFQGGEGQTVSLIGAVSVETHATPSHAVPAPVHSSPEPTTPAHPVPESASAAYTSPGSDAPAYVSPEPASPAYTSPGSASPAFVSPVSASPAHGSPGSASPAYVSPGSASPAYVSPVHSEPGPSSPVHAEAAPGYAPIAPVVAPQSPVADPAASAVSPAWGSSSPARDSAPQAAIPSAWRSSSPAAATPSAREISSLPTTSAWPGSSPTNTSGNTAPVIGAAAPGRDGTAPATAAESAWGAPSPEPEGRSYERTARLPVTPQREAWSARPAESTALHGHPDLDARAADLAARVASLVAGGDVPLGGAPRPEPENQTNLSAYLDVPPPAAPRPREAADDSDETSGRAESVRRTAARFAGNAARGRGNAPRLDGEVGSSGRGSHRQG